MPAWGTFILARASWASVCGGTSMPGSGAPGTSQKNSGSFRHSCTWAWVSFGLTGSSYHVPAGIGFWVTSCLASWKACCPSNRAPAPGSVLL